MGVLSIDVITKGVRMKWSKEKNIEKGRVKEKVLIRVQLGSDGERERSRSQKSEMQVGEVENYKRVVSWKLGLQIILIGPDIEES